MSHTIDSDTAEYLVKEFGHNPIKEEKAEEIIEKIKEVKTIMSAHGIDRVQKFAFELAKQRKRKKLTNATKSN